MNKQEALQKIKELQEYIEECDLKNPTVVAGQLYKHHDDDIYMTLGVDSQDIFTLVKVYAGKSKYAVGMRYGIHQGFAGNDSMFTYVGMAKDLISVSKT